MYVGYTVVGKYNSCCHHFNVACDTSSRLDTAPWYDLIDFQILCICFLKLIRNHKPHIFGITSLTSIMYLLNM